MISEAFEAHGVMLQGFVDTKRTLHREASSPTCSSKHTLQFTANAIKSLSNPYHQPSSLHNKY